VHLQCLLNPRNHRSTTLKSTNVQLVNADKKNQS
jgi:hypothetical protein